MRKVAAFLIIAFAGAALAAALPKPVALFTFDTDGWQVVNQNSGAAYPVPQSVAIRPGGVSGNYLALTRRDDAYVPLGKPFGFEGEYSFSFWMRTAPGYRETASMLLSRHAAGSYNGLWFMVNAEWGYGQTDKLTFYYSNVSIVSKTSVNDGRWHHVGVAHRKAGAELYIDGRLEGRGGPANVVMPNVDFVLGAITWDRPHGNFSGDLDELAIFEQPLGDRDFAELAANPQYFAAPRTSPYFLSTGPGQGPGQQGKAPEQVMRITLRDGQVLTIPVQDIGKIEFGSR